MRIQLDYYRVLGLTPQARVEQINQAHSDRIKSLPRREYSEKAISSRQKLLNVAHTVLADSSQRRVYDAQILPELIKSQDEHAFFIEIDKRELSGALLILYELGEYDQIISLNCTIDSGIFNPLDLDLILSSALAYLELGRENWNQGKYEAAAQNFAQGIAVLKTQAGNLLSKAAKKPELFPEIHQELQKNLWQLRPYQVLELMSSGATTAGIAILQELLDLRRGIDGKGDDRSGLDVDKFLLFILELRVYMTSSEQEALFEAESRRPSLVASYLNVYALVAKGVSQRQPHLIRRAKSLLNKITSSQNVYLEEAISSLLLGQVSEAIKLLDLSDETEKLATIQRQSKPENDTVKGLYHYAQGWLSTEIYPNFKELISESVDLDAYFNDPNVQAYIDELPNTSPMFSSGTSSIPIPEIMLDTPSEPRPKIAWFTPPANDSEIIPDNSNDNLNENDNSDIGIFANRSNIQTDTPQTASTRIRGSRERRYKFHPERLILFLVTVIGLVGGSIVLGYAGWNFFTSKEPVIQSENVLKPIIDSSISNIKPIETAPPQSNAAINQKVAGEIISLWQKTKADALGSGYKVEGLQLILTEPLLSEWRSRAESLRNSNSYLEYTIKSATVTQFKAIDAKQAKAITDISEIRNYFTNGKPEQKDPKPDNYQVEYVLTRINDKWMITGMNLQSQIKPLPQP